jgi:hypothetical protein
MLSLVTRRRVLVATTAAVGAFAAAAHSQTSKPALSVLIIRHAEKPGGQWPGPGLTPDGQPDKKSLVIRGWQRAGAWAALFGSGSNPAPTRIYAADPANAEGGEPSQRPFETITPLAARLGLTPVTNWGWGSEAEVAADIKGSAGVALVCWEHKAIIAKLLPALLAGQAIPDLPPKWDGSRFDVVLRFDRAEEGAPWTFRQQFPRLLSGDSARPVQFSG